MLLRFEPDESIIFFDPESEKPERFIFEIEGPYRDFEEEGLAELDKFINDHEVNFHLVIDFIEMIWNVRRQ